MSENENEKWDLVDWLIAIPSVVLIALSITMGLVVIISEAVK